MDRDDQKIVLQEYVSASSANVVEEADARGVKTKHWYLDGILMQGEIENRNGRIYPLAEIESAVSSLSERIQLFKEGRGEPVLGELDHPDTLVVNLDRVSHTIDEVHVEGNDGKGRMKILSAVPCGKIVEGFLTEGIPLGVSTRGSGNVDEYTNQVSDFDIVTVDIVATPSAMDARPTAIYEKLMYANGGKKLFNNAKDCIASNGKFTNELNEDIVAWVKSWRHK